MKASLPPSSKIDFFTFFPAADAKLAPAGSLPVRAAPFTLGSSNSSDTLEPGTKILV